MARLDYANARIGARRAQLLDASALREVLARPSLEARLELLRRLRVGTALPDVPGPDPVASAEAALREAWRRDAAGVLADAEGDRARALLGAFLGLDDAAAVKAVLRAVARGLAPDRALAAAPPSPGLGEAALRHAAAASGVEEAIDRLAAAAPDLGAALRRAATAAAAGDLLPLEVAADRAAAARAGAAARGPAEDARILRRHLEDRIDARNAATLLALAGAPPRADAFVPGGRRLPEAEFRRLAGAAAATVRAALGRLVRRGDAAALATPWGADAALERAWIAPLRREARARPLSIAVPLAYLAERRAELRRVGIVLRGAELGLAAGEILDLVEA
ncbi:MAG TPA: V-type ATPase subunit [Anaeromyxobacter sp.]|nr:V-type ATPase subunit [Anaeromyxobacter sp.]